jgi:hypothetical protein
MNNILEKREIENLKKVISNLEWNIRYGPMAQWALLLLGLALFGLAIYVGIRAEEARLTRESSLQESPQDSKFALLADSIIKFRAEQLRVEFQSGNDALEWRLLGAVLVGFGIAQWNRRKTSGAQLVRLKTLVNKQPDLADDSS